MVKRIFSKVLKPCISFINLLSEVWLPSTIFLGSRELVAISPTLRHTHSSPAILCRFSWYCIIALILDTAVVLHVLAWFHMSYLFEMFYKDDLYFMHELSCTWDLCWDLILWLWIYIWNFILLEMMFKWKVFYILLI